jgi:hypothetical protein
MYTCSFLSVSVSELLVVSYIAVHDQLYWLSGSHFYLAYKNNNGCYNAKRNSNGESSSNAEIGFTFYTLQH